MWGAPSMCTVAVSAGLLSSQGEAFLCPGGALRAGARGMTYGRTQQRLTTTRPIARMSLQRKSGADDDREGALEDVPLRENAFDAPRKGPLRRVRSLFSRKAATAAAVSALVTAGTSGPAEALWGRGKTPEAPSVPIVERQLEGEVDGLVDATDGALAGDEEEWAETLEAAEALEASENAVTSATEEGVSAGEKGTDDDLTTTTPLALSEEGSVPSSEVDGRGQKDSAGAIGGGVLGNVRTAVAAKPEMAAVAIVGAAGVTLLYSRSQGGSSRRQSYGRNNAASRARGAAPKSPFAGIGKPRVSPEVAAAKAKKRAASLESAKFDVDLELFGDAVSDLPSRPPPPTPPTPEPSPSPSEVLQGVRAESSAEAAAAAAAAAEEAAAAAAATVPAEVAAESAPVQSSPSPAPVEKPKRKGPMMNLFKRDSGPQRATSVEDAIKGETPDVAVFRQATAAVLSKSAPAGAFEVDEPTVLAEAAITPVEGEGEEAETAAASSRISALSQLMEAAGLSMTEAAEAVADIVNAMVVSLVDNAVRSKDDDATSAAADALLSYMDGAGGLFAGLCPGVALDPPIKYNGSYKKGKLEKVFEAAARGALKIGDESQMAKLDRLQDLFSIKEAKANSITQKIMMDLMMKMMSGEGEDAEGIEKMMAAMGEAGMGGGMSGMGAGRTPEEHKREVEALKAMVESGDVPKEEVDGLRKMYKDSGMDIDQLVNDPMMESSMDADAKEVVVLLRKLLAAWPAK